MTDVNNIRASAERVILLEAELESSGEAAISDAAVQEARAKLRAWVDTVVGVVSSPGMGRVTLIHANGRETRISSPDLPYLLVPPVTFAGDGSEIP